jgi:hypothetical protein
VDLFHAIRCTIAPYMLRVVFRGFDGAPFKLAEVFGFGRVNPTWRSDLVLWSPDGDSGRPVGKDECRGDPKCKLSGGALSFGYFALGKQRKVTRPTGRNQSLNYTYRITTALQTSKREQKPITPIRQDSWLNAFLQTTKSLCASASPPQKTINRNSDRYIQ